MTNPQQSHESDQRTRGSTEPTTARTEVAAESPRQDQLAGAISPRFRVVARPNFGERGGGARKGAGLRVRRIPDSASTGRVLASAFNPNTGQVACSYAGNDDHNLTVRDV